LLNRQMGSKNMTTKQLVVVWRVYEPCNLSCHFCEYSREIIRPRHITPTDVILRFGKTLSEYQQKTGNKVLVNWLGGEPLLWKELPTVSNTYKNDYSIKLSVTTNGTSLNSEKIRRVLLENYSNMTISIDGFEKFHDFHRGEKGLFEKVKSYIAQLKDEISSCQSPLKIRINTVLMQENIYLFEEFCLEVAKWGIQELTFNQLGGIDRSEFYSKQRLLPEQAQWLAAKLPAVRQKVLTQGLQISGNQQYLDRIVATSTDVVIPIDDCSPGKSFLFINEENLASPCSFTTKEYGISLSEIENVNDLIQLPAKFIHKRNLYRAMSCNDCHSTQVFGKFQL
jgi:sulfatase maturation enzyme AslB (radical SAM superfamily)